LALALIVSLTLVLAAGVFVFTEDTQEANPDSCPSPVELAESPTQTEEKRYLNEYSWHSRPEWSKEENATMSGTNEITRYPSSRPTEEDLDAAWELYNESYEAAEENGWFDYQEAVEDGYKRIDRPHYINLEYTFDGDQLNPHKPEQLVYYDSPDSDKMILAGFMYTTLGEGRQVGGPLTLWHYHSVQDPNRSSRLEELISESSEVEMEGAEAVFEMETQEGRTVEMIHVWFVRHPEGPFASSMRVPEENLQEPEKMSERGFKCHAYSSYQRFFR